MHNVSKNS